MSVKTSLLGNLSSNFATTGSDHAAVGVTMAPKRAVPAHSQPIPRWIAEHPLFADCFEKLLRKVDLDALPPFEALKATKILMRSAGKITEKEAFRKDAADPAVRMQLIL
jgi:hypothetical protein